MPAEKNAVDKFIQQRGKKPETPDDWAAVHIIAYPNMSDLPDKLKNDTTMSYYQGANAAPASRPDLAGLQSDVDTSEKRLTELGQGNEAMRILQEAIRKKAGTAKAPLGESEIFKMAGVGGMGALTASLNTRADEISTNHATFLNTIGKMSGQYADMANIALRKYEVAMDNYNRERDYLNQLDRDMRQHEEAIEMAELQDQFTKENIRLRESFSSSSGGGDEDPETTYFNDTLMKSAENLDKLKGKPEFEASYRQEVSDLLATFDWPEERRGEMESAVNTLMTPDLDTMGVEDVAEDWLRTTAEDTSDLDLTNLLEGGMTDKEFVDYITDRDDKTADLEEDKNIMIIGGSK